MLKGNKSSRFFSWELLMERSYDSYRPIICMRPCNILAIRCLPELQLPTTNPLFLWGSFKTWKLFHFSPLVNNSFVLFLSSRLFSYAKMSLTPPWTSKKLSIVLHNRANNKCRVTFSHLGSSLIQVLLQPETPLRAELLFI